jgi:hypothetical protein
MQILWARVYSDLGEGEEEEEEEGPHHRDSRCVCVAVLECACVTVLVMPNIYLFTHACISVSVCLRVCVFCLTDR